MSYRTRQAWRELVCQVFGHRWYLFSAQVFIDFQEVTLYWMCSRCLRSEFPTVALPMVKPPKRLKRGR